MRYIDLFPTAISGIRSIDRFPLRAENYVFSQSLEALVFGSSICVDPPIRIFKVFARALNHFSRRHDQYGLCQEHPKGSHIIWLNSDVEPISIYLLIKVVDQILSSKISISYLHFVLIRQKKIK